MSEALKSSKQSSAHLEPLIKLGAISHIGIVVEDLDAAVKFYGEVFGVGPFDIVDFDASSTDFFRSYGESASPKFRAGLYYEGNFFIELVQVLEGDTVHTRFFDKHGEGLQHLCFMVEKTEDVLEKLATRGIKPVLDYQFSAGEGDRTVTIREVYLNTSEFEAGTTIQLLEYITS